MISRGENGERTTMDGDSLETMETLGNLDPYANPSKPL